MARLTKANPAGMPARNQLSHSMRVCEYGGWQSFLERLRDTEGTIAESICMDIGFVEELASHTL